MSGDRLLFVQFILTFNLQMHISRTDFHPDPLNAMWNRCEYTCTILKWIGRPGLKCAN